MASTITVPTWTRFDPPKKMRIRCCATLGEAGADAREQYHPGYFGKVGMRYFHKQQVHFWKPVINLDKVNTILSKLRLFSRKTQWCKRQRKLAMDTLYIKIRSLIIFSLALVSRSHRDPRCLRRWLQEGHRPGPRPPPPRLLQGPRQGPPSRNPARRPRKMG